MLRTSYQRQGLLLVGLGPPLPCHLSQLCRAFLPLELPLPDS